MTEVVQDIASLIVVFGWGIVVGIEAAKRNRKPSQDEQFGALIKHEMARVHSDARWLERGAGWAATRTLTAETDTGRFDIIIRETV